ncbi:long chain acyl-CoA synthetase 2-like isoform X2 [Arachis ipaensis]|uniref:long chain acyl-CoA synthetase 2-like isoform X2 n=1 Tax=Arachis ipaensis TaxID=130454 RepID=UPI000A2B7DB9|nr:long chain acyl-CoA synthetase 2-like isoform X2 [Arachis ipaensis]
MLLIAMSNMTWRSILLVLQQRKMWQRTTRISLSSLMTKQALGGRVQILLLGAAPLPRHVEEFMRATSGSTLSQGYGLTESCAGCFTAIE